MKSLRAFIIFPIHLSLQLINLGLWGSLVILFGLLKLLLPISPLQEILLAIMHRLYFSFGIFSVALIKVFNRIEIRIEIDPGKVAGWRCSPDSIASIHVHIRFRMQSINGQCERFVIDV